LLIAGTRPSKFRKISEAERTEVTRAIVESGAALTFVGLGCPRQEVWVFEHRDRLDMPLVAVGAAFSFLAGWLKDAPHVMQNAGLEWLFRLVQEPVRLWKRYLILNPLYLGLLVLQMTGLRPFDARVASPPTDEIRYG
jgi:exopolysaccharide biosynthesis WecB/TagA/CpsF family protein